MRGDYPEFREWSIPAVWLLKGVVEQGEGRAWPLLLAHRGALEHYFSRLGLQLIVDETDGLAYLRQFPEDEDLPPGYESIPKLGSATPLSYGQTLLCVLLREALRRFEEEQTAEDRCVVDEAGLLAQWKGFFPHRGDDVRQLRDMQEALHKLEELGYVRRFGNEGANWEVRRILKARVTADTLEEFQETLRRGVEDRQRDQQGQHEADRQNEADRSLEQFAVARNNTHQTVRKSAK